MVLQGKFQRQLQHARFSTAFDPEKLARALADRNAEAAILTGSPADRRRAEKRRRQAKAYLGRYGCEMQALTYKA